MDIHCFDTESMTAGSPGNYNTNSYVFINQAISLVTQDPTLIPEYKTKGAAGADLKASKDISLPPNSQTVVPTGISLAIPEGFVGLAFPRSGLGTKGITLANSVGVIDSDYRGEILLVMKNTTNETFELRKGDRIAQIVFLPVVQFPFVSVDKLPDTARGTGGFGSTDIK